MSRLRIGTCSWKFPSWQGLVYSAARGAEFLNEYATLYDTVEIDQWFWSLFYPHAPVLPRSDTVHEYLAAVPPDFRFTIKVPNSITLTHYYGRETAGELIENPDFLSVPLYEAFRRRIEPLLPQTGVLLFQFEYLNRRKMSSLSAFLERLRAFFEQAARPVPVAIECRNPPYLTGEYYRFLSGFELYPVFAQGYYLPDIRELYAERCRATPGLAVIRLLGYDRAGIETESRKRWDRRLRPHNDELAGVAAMIDDMLSRGSEVYVNVNNHYEGSAPLTIEALREKLSDRR